MSGDDHELFYRILSRGYRAAYDPDAVVRHTHRRDWASLRAVMYGYGVGVFAWWTRALVIERECGLLRIGPGYFWCHLVKNVVVALMRRPGSIPIDLAFAECLGALAGPRSYFRGRRRLAVERLADRRRCDERQS